MENLTNLSVPKDDGTITDGFLVLYVKDGKVRPIGLSTEQAETLDMSLALPFIKSDVKILKGLVNIKKGILGGITE